MGIPVARKWPRSPGKRRTPAVEAQWPIFAAAAKLWNELSQEVKDAYIKMASGTALAGRDLFTKSYITGIYRYTHEVTPPPTIQYLNDLFDVEVPDPEPGQMLSWNQAANRWEAK